MDLNEFKLHSLGIDKKKFGKIYTFVDFGNVNKWFDNDERDWDNNILLKHQKLIVDIEKLANFINLFSAQKRFYYGFDPKKPASLHISIKAEDNGFIKANKPIQWIKHYINDGDLFVGSKSIERDGYGFFIKIPKCNFDVEICLDAVRLRDYYDTICLFSSDNDFTKLLEFLRKEGKQVILLESGHVSYFLKEQADLPINAQQIKGSICIIKNKQKPRLLESGIWKSDSHPRAG